MLKAEKFEHMFIMYAESEHKHSLFFLMLNVCIDLEESHIKTGWWYSTSGQNKIIKFLLMKNKNYILRMHQLNTWVTIWNIYNVLENIGSLKQSTVCQ